MIVTAIDPGPTKSGIATWDGHKPYNFGKFLNQEILTMLRNNDETFQLVIEAINPYSIGYDTRDTLIWSGVFQEAYNSKRICEAQAVFMLRDSVRQGLCGMRGSKINDKVIRQALVDRFARGQKNYGKGTKKNPGFFYRFSADVWQAFALAVVYYDLSYK